VRFQGLPPSGAATMPFSRPVKHNQVILILPTTNATIKQQYGGAAALGCYQMLMGARDTLNWVDPPYSFQLLTGIGGAVVHQIGF
jgi:hypothetical protein